MKLCVDCKHFDGGSASWGKCLRPHVHPVVGTRPLDLYADVERMFGHVGCGPSAKYFEPKVVPTTTYSNLGIVVDHDPFEHMNHMRRNKKNVVQRVLEYFK